MRNNDEGRAGFELRWLFGVAFWYHTHYALRVLLD
jgi:hypothetical protein